MTRILLLEVLDKKLEDYYTLATIQHNKEIDSKEALADSGFDLVCPEIIRRSEEKESISVDTKLIGLKVKAAAYEVRNFIPSQSLELSNDLCRAYDLCVRSSIYKTPWRLSNNIGIIDSAYRGELHAGMDYNRNYGKNGTSHNLEEMGRYWQIVMPDRKPFKVYMVERLNKTERGEGGLGSTGETGIKKINNL